MKPIGEPVVSGAICGLPPISSLCGVYASIMNIANVSRFTGIPNTTIKRWVSAGIIPRTDDLSTIVKAIILHKDREIQDSKKGLGSLDLENELLREKIRLIKAQAEREEIKNAVALKTLVSAEEVTKTWKTVCIFISSRLQSLPRAIAASLYGKDMDFIESRLSEEISDALEELSNGNL